MVSSKKNTSPGVRQCLKILAWTARNPEGIGFNELRERIFNIPPSTLTRHLKLLTEENWLKKDEKGHYCPGPAYLCAVTNLAGRPNPDAIIRPVLDRLSEETGHSAAFAEWDRGGIRFRLKRDMPRSYCYPDSRELLRDVFTHPFGLTALAFLPDSVVSWNRDSRPQEILNVFGDLEEGKIRLESLRREIREKGFYEASYGCSRICAPVFFRNGDLAGVLGISLLGDRRGNEVDLLRDGAKEIEKMEL